jgi:hypothetical protein
MKVLTLLKHVGAGLSFFVVGFVIADWNQLDEKVKAPATEKSVSFLSEGVAPACAIAANLTMRTTHAVTKKTYSNRVRFIFIAGMGGTGHHGWDMVLTEGNVCVRSVRLERAIRNLWWGNDVAADRFAERVGKCLVALTTQAMRGKGSVVYCLNAIGHPRLMYSYPNSNSPRHHPNVYSLAKIAEEVKVDLRIIVIHRAPAPQLVSLSINRNFLSLPEEAHQMSNQGALINSQLHAIDPRFFVCVGHTDVVSERKMLQHHLFGEMMFASWNNNSDISTILSSAILKHYHAKDDNIAEKLKTIRNQSDGGMIQTKLDEMEVYYNYLVKELCPRLNSSK